MNPVTAGFSPILDFHSRNWSQTCSPAGLLPIAEASVELPPLQELVFCMDRAKVSYCFCACTYMSNLPLVTRPLKATLTSELKLSATDESLFSAHTHCSK